MLELQWKIITQLHQATRKAAQNDNKGTIKELKINKVHQKQTCTNWTGETTNTKTNIRILITHELIKMSKNKICLIQTLKKQ